MLIETYDKVYAVIRHYYAGMQTDIYVCRCRSDQRLYEIIRVRDKKITEKIMEFISAQKSSRKFLDLTDAFVYEGDLHVVFFHTEGMTLEKKLEQPCTLEERMETGRKLLERMILSGQPYYFQCQCLCPEHILVTDSLDIRFWYTLQDAENYSAYTQQQAAAYLYRVLQLLSAPELQKRGLKPLVFYFRRLKEVQQLDYVKEYEQYTKTFEEIRKIPKDELELSESFMYHVWELFKSVRRRIQKMMLALIFTGVFFYMIYCIYWSFRAKGYARHFDAIGTMQMDEEQTYDEIYK